MSTHPMKRGQKRIAYLAYSLLTIATLICSTSATHNSRCPTTVSIAGKIIYLTVQTEWHCSRIFSRNHLPNTTTMLLPNLLPNKTHQHSNTSHFKHRILRKEVLLLKLGGKCSFNNGRHKDTLHINNVPSEILSYKPPQVCSFQKSSICANDRKLGIFYQIELYEESLFLNYT